MNHINNNEEQYLPQTEALGYTRCESEIVRVTLSELYQIN